MVHIHLPQRHLHHFIDLMLQYPCLWDTTHDDYEKKEIEFLALDQLHKKYKEKDEAATHLNVKYQVQFYKKVYLKLDAARPENQEKVSAMAYRDKLRELTEEEACEQYMQDVDAAPVNNGDREDNVENVDHPQDAEQE